uniref:EOG090X0CST n=1 Tax=Moina brachiata TaxID=675436 RepID=A0A4Y7NJB4_9CRUS|nr:EOG090X0CST [Moina brachiata]
MYKYPTSPMSNRDSSPTFSDSSGIGYVHPASLRGPSPLPSPANMRTGCLSAASKRYKFIRKLCHFQQMDFEYAVWQMIYLFISPQKVYRNFHYRKSSKAQFARDDPAFLVLLGVWLCVSSMVFSFYLDLSIINSIKFLLYTIFIDCLLLGAVVATAMWFVANKFLMKPTVRGEDVEWGYAFDVHLNAYFPALIILHVVQLFFYRVLISENWWSATFVGNTLWLIAVGYYIYINFLGYSSLPILHKTRGLLYPFSALFVIYIISLACNWNVTHTLINFYHSRVHVI